MQLDGRYVRVSSENHDELMISQKKGRISLFFLAHACFWGYGSLAEKFGGT